MDSRQNGNQVNVPSSDSRQSNDQVNMPSSNSFDVLLQAHQALETSAENLLALNKKRRSLSVSSSQALALPTSDDLQEAKKRRKELMKQSAVQFQKLKLITQTKQQLVDALTVQVQALQEAVAASNAAVLLNEDSQAVSIASVSTDEANIILQDLNARLNSQAVATNTATTLQTYIARHALLFSNQEALTRQTLDQKIAENKQATDLLAATQLPVIKK